MATETWVINENPSFDTQFSEAVNFTANNGAAFSQIAVNSRSGLCYDNKAVIFDEYSVGTCSTSSGLYISSTPVITNNGKSSIDCRKVLGFPKTSSSYPVLISTSTTTIPVTSAGVDLYVLDNNLNPTLAVTLYPTQAYVYVRWSTIASSPQSNVHAMLFVKYNDEYYIQNTENNKVYIVSQYQDMLNMLTTISSASYTRNLMSCTSNRSAPSINTLSNYFLFDADSSTTESCPQRNIHFGYTTTNQSRFGVFMSYGSGDNRKILPSADYRTITFETSPTGDLLTWLQANGTKQQPTYTFKHWKKSNVKVNRTLVGEKYYYFKPYTILGLYTIATTLTNCTGASANATKIQENGGLTLTFTANSGYELPTGVSVTNVTSYNWNKATGVLAISKPTGDVAIEIVAVSALPQLTTPTNVAVTDTTLTFDEVANATSYEVFVDNVSIGTHSTVTGYTISWSGGGKTPSISVSINDGEWVKLAEATGSINNVKTIKFLAEFNEFMVATVESTTLNLNFSGDGKPSSITAGSIISSEYTLTQDVTDLVISTAPRITTI